MYWNLVRTQIPPSPLHTQLRESNLLSVNRQLSDNLILKLVRQHIPEKSFLNASEYISQKNKSVSRLKKKVMGIKSST